MSQPDGSFLYSYTIEDAHPNQRHPSHYFGRNRYKPTASGLRLEVNVGFTGFLITPHDQQQTPWVAHLEQGTGGLSGSYSTPNPNCVCVVVNGQGYWLHVDFPGKFSIVDVAPIKGVIESVDNQVLLLHDYTTLVAYGPLGFLWHTPDVSWDGIKDLSIAGKELRGLGWDSPADSWVPFCVSLLTGETHGGSSPSAYASQ